MLGRKGEANQGGEKRQLRMAEENLQVTCEIIHPLSPLTNMYQIGTLLVSTGYSPWLQDPLDKSIS